MLSVEGYKNYPDKRYYIFEGLIYNFDSLETVKYVIFNSIGSINMKFIEEIYNKKFDEFQKYIVKEDFFYYNWSDIFTHFATYNRKDMIEYLVNNGKLDQIGWMNSMIYVKNLDMFKYIESLRDKIIVDGPYIHGENHDDKNNKSYLWVIPNSHGYYSDNASREEFINYITKKIYDICSNSKNIEIREYAKNKLDV